MYNFLLIAENKETPFASVLRNLTVELPPTSILYIDNDTSKSLSSKLDTTPLLTTGWLVFCNFRHLEPSVLVKLSSLNNGNNLYIISTDNKDRFDEMLVTISTIGVKYKSLLNLYPTKEEMLSYISSELECSTDLSEYILSRTKTASRVGRLVELLKDEENITKQLIKDLTSEEIFVSYQYFLDFVAGVKPVEGRWGVASEKSRYKKCLKLIRRYRNRPSHLISYVARGLENYNLIFNKVINGEIRMTHLLDDYKEICKDNMEKVGDEFLSKFRSVSFSTFKEIVKAVEYIPQEKLMILESRYKKLAMQKNVDALVVIELLTRYAEGM